MMNLSTAVRELLLLKFAIFFLVWPLRVETKLHIMKTVDTLVVFTISVRLFFL